jgi:phage terminase large subunit-like protein
MWVDRSKERYYSYEPYYNRSDGSPGWQWKFLMAAGDYKGRVALGANRIGKSEQGAYECALAVTGKHPTRDFPESGVGWIIGLDNPMIRDIDRPLFEQFLPTRFKTKFYKQDNLWICHGDGREWKIVFKSTEMGPDKFQGAKIDFAWVDEEPKRVELFSEMEARLVDRQGIWWVTATPVRGTAWLKALSERADVFRTFAGMRENPYLPLQAVEEYALTLPEDERDVRIEGIYVTFGGNPVFPGRLIREHIKRLESRPVGIEGNLEMVA